MNGKEILIAITFLITLSFCSLCFATPIMSEDQASDIINHFKNSSYNSYYGSSGYTEVTQSQIIEYLNAIDLDEFCYFFNNAFETVSGDVATDTTWSNISVVFLNGRYDYQKEFWFFITKGNTNLNVGEMKVHNYQNTHLEIRPYNDNPVYVARYSLSNNESLSSFSFKLLTNSNGAKILPFESTFTISGDEIEVPFIYALSDSQYTYWNNTKYKLKISTTFSDSGSDFNNTYFNYDLGSYMKRPKIYTDTIDGYSLYQPDDPTIFYHIDSQSGDEYYPFNSLKVDLQVFQADVLSGDSNIYLTALESYKRVTGSFVDTSGVLNTSYNQSTQMFTYDYNLKSKFNSDFINTYISSTDNTSQYAFRLALYNYWGDLISVSNYFYFYNDNYLSSKPFVNANLWNGDDSNNFNINNINSDFSSLIDTFKSFMQTIMAFLVFLPSWLIALISLGITASIAIRVLGR